MHSAVIKSCVTGHSVFARLLACSAMRYSTSNAIPYTIGTLPARGTIMLARLQCAYKRAELEHVWSSVHRLGDVGKLVEEEEAQRQGLFSRGRFDTPTPEKAERDAGATPPPTPRRAGPRSPLGGSSPRRPWGPAPRTPRHRGLRPGSPGRAGPPPPAGARPGCQAGSF